MSAGPALDVVSLFPAFLFAFVGAGVSAVVGGAVGAVAGTLDVPGRRAAIVVSAVLLAAPPAFWWIGLTRLPVGVGQFNGTIAGGVIAGAVLAPITLLFVLAATREIPSNAYEAARVSLGPARRIGFVLVPLLRPALVAGFLLTAILLLGESEIPFLFGFRTSMTDVVTTFSQTFDARRTAPIIVPLVLAVLVLTLLMVKPLFAVLLPAAGGGRGVIRKPARAFTVGGIFGLPVLVGLSLTGYARAALSGGRAVWVRLSIGAPEIAISIAEPVLCAFAAVAVAVVIAYPLRRSAAIRMLAVASLLLFCVPTAITAIAWIAAGQAVGRLAVPPAVAHVSRTVGLALLGFLIAYARVPRSLENAADLVSLSSVDRAWTLMLPLVRLSLAAIAALIAALVFSDRDVASLLLAPGQSRLMLNLYLLSANAPSAAVGATALITFLCGTLVIGLAAAGPALLWAKRRG